MTASILTVDDSPSLRMAIRIALTGAGYAVTEAGDVAQLVKDARTRKGPVFRLVKVMVEKLEFVMPPQDGAHLKDRFRAALLGRA